MPALNRVEPIGPLVKDPETRFTATGRKVLKSTVAVNRTWKTGDGEPREVTDWFNVDTWGKLGETCQQYLYKGWLIYVEGGLQADSYEHEGDTRYFTKLVARHIQMLDPKAEEAEVVAEGEPDADP